MQSIYVYTRDQHRYMHSRAQHSGSRVSDTESQVLKALKQTSRFLDAEKSCLDARDKEGSTDAGACEQLAAAVKLQRKIDALERIKVCRMHVRWSGSRYVACMCVGADQGMSHSCALERIKVCRIHVCWSGSRYVAYMCVGADQGMSHACAVARVVPAASGIRHVMK